MEEMIDILDKETGEKTGKIISKDEAHKTGKWHGAIHVLYVDMIKEQLNNNGIISNEFVSIYVVYANINIEDIKLQEEEVSEVKWCSKEELNKLISANKMIPHVREYEILNSILK